LRYVQVRKVHLETLEQLDRRDYIVSLVRQGTWVLLALMVLLVLLELLAILDYLVLLDLMAHLVYSRDYRDLLARLDIKEQLVT